MINRDAKRSNREKKSSFSDTVFRAVVGLAAIGFIVPCIPSLIRAQAPAAAPEFDAASVKPIAGSGGGGREGPLAGAPLEFEPGRVASIGGVTVLRLIMEAYHVTQYQVSGGPGWLDLRAVLPLRRRRLILRPMRTSSG